MSTSEPSAPPPGVGASKLVRVLLVEGAHVVRRGLAVSLVADPTVRLVGAPRMAVEAYHLVPKCLTDVAVVGTRPADATAIEVVRGLRRRFTGVGVILVSAQPTDDDLFAAIQSGAAAYLDLNADLPTIQTTVRRVAAGEYLINDHGFDREDPAEWVRARFRDRSSSVPPGAVGTSLLTEREREVLQLLAVGKTVEQVAQELGINLPIARYHLRSIIRKLAIDASDERDDSPRDEPPGDDPPRDGPLKAGVPVRPREPWSPPGHLRTAVPLPGTEKER